MTLSFKRRKEGGINCIFSPEDRVVIKISSCQANDTSRRGVQQLGILFGLTFLPFSYKGKRRSRS